MIVGWHTFKCVIQSPCHVCATMTNAPLSPSHHVERQGKFGECVLKSKMRMVCIQQLTFLQSNVVSPPHLDRNPPSSTHWECSPPAHDNVDLRWEMKGEVW